MTTCEWRAILRNCPSGPPRPRSAQARCGFVRSLDTLLEVPNQLGQRRSDGGAPIPQLHEVQPALSALDTIVVALEVIWSPSVETDRMSLDAMLARYPELTALDA